MSTQETQIKSVDQYSKELNNLSLKEWKLYKKETKEKVEEIEEKIQFVKNEFHQQEKIKVNKRLQYQLSQIKKDVEAFKNEIQEQEKRWEEHMKEATELFSKVEHLLDNANYYSKTLVFALNRLKGEMTEAEKIKSENPFHSSEELKKEIEKTKNEFENFTEIRKEIEELIVKIEPIKQDVEKKKYTKVLGLQHDLYVNLQSGEYEVAREKIKDIKITLKRHL